MARLIPTDPGTAAASAGERAEQETLRSLAAALSDAYTIFHGVRWADESDRATPVGELDFVVVNQGAAVLLVEQKAGELSETENGFMKVYAAPRRSPPRLTAGPTTSSANLGSPTRAPAVDLATAKPTIDGGGWTDAARKPPARRMRVYRP